MTDTATANTAELRELNEESARLKDLCQKAEGSENPEHLWRAAKACLEFLMHNPVTPDDTTAQALQPLAEYANKRIAHRTAAGMDTWDGLLALDTYRDAVRALQSLVVRPTLDPTILEQAELAILAQLPKRFLRASLHLLSEVAPALALALRGTPEASDGQVIANQLTRWIQATAINFAAAAQGDMECPTNRFYEKSSWRSYDPTDGHADCGLLLHVAAHTANAFHLCTLMTLAHAPKSNPNALALSHEVARILDELEDTMARAAG